MTTLRRILLALALSALAASNASAQDVKTPPGQLHEASPAAPAPITPVADAATPRAKPDTLPPLVLPPVLWSERAGAQWVRTAGYKAAFDGASFTFLPYLGADAPKNEPIAFELGAVRVAGSELATSAPVVRRDGDRVEVDHGAFVERFDARVDGVEQSFVFDRLDRRGALELEVGVETELAHSADADGHVFAGERGAVRYGRATAIDADGRKAELETVWTGDALRIEVPAAFVAQAKLPFVVDPLTMNLSVTSSGADTIRPDLAFDVQNNLWAAVYELAFNAADHDVYVQSFFDSGTLYQTLAIDLTTANWQTPHIANCRSGSQFLVVATVGNTPTREIDAVRLDATTFLAQPPVRLDSFPGDKLDPDVGGDPANSVVGAFAVVWTRVFSATDRDVHGRLVYTDGTMSGLNEAQLDNTSNTLDERPRISNACGIGAGAKWTVVYQRATTPTNHDILGIGWGRNGSFLDPIHAIDNGSGDTTSPVVSPATDAVNGVSASLCVYETVGAGGVHGIVARFLNGTTVLGTYLLSNGSNDEVQPDVDTNGRVFGVSSERERTIGVQDYGTAYYTLAFVPNSARVTESFFPASSSTRIERYPRVYAKHSAGATSQRIGVVFDQMVTAIDRDVDFLLYDADATPEPLPYCFGLAATCPCGNVGAQDHGCANSANPAGAQLAATGDSVLSLETLTLHVTGLPATATCLFFQGDAATAPVPFGDGSLCAGGTVVRLRTKAAAAGSATYPEAGDLALSVRGQVPPEGGVRFYQVWYRNAAAFCTAATYNASNGVVAWWLP